MQAGIRAKDESLLEVYSAILSLEASAQDTSLSVQIVLPRVPLPDICFPFVREAEVEQGCLDEHRFTVGSRLAGYLKEGVECEAERTNSRTFSYFVVGFHVDCPDCTCSCTCSK